MTAVPAMTSCRALRSRPSTIPANPSPHSRKLSGNASVRSTARRVPASPPSAWTTRIPSSAMPNVLPFAAQEQA